MVWCLCGWMFCTHAEAADKRIALLVGHQQGWKGEEHLRHTVTGDLTPLKKALVSVGFRVYMLANRSPETVRKTFRQLSTQKIDTFLFYYSGHAGPKAFHIGPRRAGQPFTYQEFQRLFVQTIRASRRIAVIDACFGSRLLRMFKKNRIILKGPRRRVRRNLIKVLQPTIGKTRGVQLIVSSQIHAFEDQKRRSSIFTHYMLEGIRGKRAADADQDGSITVAEIFRYAGKRFQQETGEEPSFFDYTIKSVTPYGLVPAYNSSLYVNARTTGTLSISVGNFIWSQFKPKGRSYRLRVVSGRGKIRLKRGNRCYMQDIHFPKEREITLRNKWTTSPCDTRWLRKKGLFLQPRYETLMDRAPQWSLSLLSGYTGWLSDTRENHAAFVDLSASWNHILSLGVLFSRGGAHNIVASEGSWFDITQLHLRLGLQFSQEIGAVFRYGIGLYAMGGIFLQHAQAGDASSPSLGGGLQVSASFRLHTSLRLLILGRGGIHWLPLTQGSGLSFQGHAGIGIAWDL
ncbi:MAG: hypothetical protein CL920_21200 [Deltaproteobacteria bacterium]|nr:hypothetical protein [Deltaproteobacteria bacterium]